LNTKKIWSKVYSLPPPYVNKNVYYFTLSSYIFRSICC